MCMYCNWYEAHSVDVTGSSTENWMAMFLEASLEQDVLEPIFSVNPRRGSNRTLCLPDKMCGQKHYYVCGVVSLQSLKTPVPTFEENKCCRVIHRLQFVGMWHIPYTMVYDGKYTINKLTIGHHICLYHTYHTVAKIMEHLLYVKLNVTSFNLKIMATLCHA